MLFCEWLLFCFSLNSIVGIVLILYVLLPHFKNYSFTSAEEEAPRTPPELTENLNVPISKPGDVG